MANGIINGMVKQIFNGKNLRNGFILPDSGPNHGAAPIRNILPSPRSHPSQRRAKEMVDRKDREPRAPRDHPVPKVAKLQLQAGFRRLLPLRPFQHRLHQLSQKQRRSCSLS